MAELFCLGMKKCLWLNLCPVWLKFSMPNWIKLKWFLWIWIHVGDFFCPHRIKKNKKTMNQFLNSFFFFFKLIRCIFHVCVKTRNRNSGANNDVHLLLWFLNDVQLLLWFRARYQSSLGGCHPCTGTTCTEVRNSWQGHQLSSVIIGS